jgi:hypothetical protein
MTVSEVINDNLINLSELSRKIYGEKKQTYLYRKINKKDGLSLRNKDFELIADYFEKNFKINLELI